MGMKEIFATPIPLVVGVVLFSALSFRRIRDTMWAKWTRRVIGVILLFLLLPILLLALRMCMVVRVPASQLDEPRERQQSANNVSERTAKAAAQD